ncbi:hypothetical protein OS493_022974 [Desmophyllum pertusum]|uniref:Uncharacterized protein n=1 Tax=Desmophyllum pertusum TaxID=174260 RepID=A0A9W9ZBI8_9CNID|nr:hypothetical protein OS493_022974 [Desmophyllum pertusum]
MEFRQHLDTALKEIIRDLQQGGHRGYDSDTTGLRLEVLYETALINEDISLEAIDLINEARKHLNVTSYQQQPFRGYEAPVASEEGRRGRPKFAISSSSCCFSERTISPIKDMAHMLGVSKRTIENRMAEYELTNKSRYSDIHIPALDIEFDVCVVLVHLTSFENCIFKRTWKDMVLILRLRFMMTSMMQCRMGLWFP